MKNNIKSDPRFHKNPKKDERNKSKSQVPIDTNKLPKYDTNDRDLPKPRTSR